MSQVNPGAYGPILSDEEAAQLDDLLALHRQLRVATAAATTPAVEQALRQADLYLFLALSHFGYSQDLLPDDEAGPPDERGDHGADVAD